MSKKSKQHDKQLKQNAVQYVTPVFRLQRLIRVGDGAEKRLLSDVLSRLVDCRPVLDVHKLAPGLRVIREPLHKAGVAVLAGVGTSHIGIDREIRYGQIRFRQDVFHFDLFDYHSRTSSIFLVCPISDGWNQCGSPACGKTETPQRQAPAGFVFFTFSEKAPPAQMDYEMPFLYFPQGVGFEPT